MLDYVIYPLKVVIKDVCVTLTMLDDHLCDPSALAYLYLSAVIACQFKQVQVTLIT